MSIYHNYPCTDSVYLCRGCQYFSLVEKCPSLFRHIQWVFFCQPVLIFNLFHEFLTSGLIFIFLNEIFCQPIVIFKFNLIYTVETALWLHLNSVSDISSLCYICSLHAQYTFHSHHGMTHCGAGSISGHGITLNAPSTYYSMDQLPDSYHADFLSTNHCPQGCLTHFGQGQGHLKTTGIVSCKLD
jgi:hypothetical protein